MKLYLSDAYVALLLFGLQNVPLPSENVRLSFVGCVCVGGGVDPLAIPLGNLELGELGSKTLRSPLVPAAPVQSFPCAAVGFGSRRGVEIPAFRASLKLDAQPIARGEEGNEKQSSRVVFFSP